MIVSLANLLTSKGHNVTLIIVDESSDSFYPIHPDVKIIQTEFSFGIGKGSSKIGRKILLLRDLYRLSQLLKKLRPQVIICSENVFSICTVLCGAIKYSRVMAWEHHHHGAQHINTFWKILLKFTYKRLDSIVCLNEDERQHYLKLNPRALVIPNFVDNETDVGHVQRNPQLLLSVTRFNYIKGIDLLMQTSVKVLRNHPNLKWLVVGYGEQYKELLDFVSLNCLCNQLIIVKAKGPSIEDLYKEATLLVLTSRNECFPMTLLEAQAAGLPALSFDCDTGPRHIISNRHTGLLVEKENIDALSEAISVLINDKQLLAEMSSKAQIASLSYTSEAVYCQWYYLLQSFTPKAEVKDKKTFA